MWSGRNSSPSKGRVFGRVPEQGRGASGVAASIGGAGYQRSVILPPLTS